MSDIPERVKKIVVEHLGVEKEIITKSGSFFSYGDVRLGQGRDSTRKFLKEEKLISDEIEKKIRKAE